MKETVLITGAHGLIARHLFPLLETDYVVKRLSRNPDEEGMYRWDVESGYIEPEALEGIDHIVHLAGAKFYDGGPVTEERKAISLNSRAGAAGLLLQALRENNRVLKSFISASAAGLYDFNTDEQLIDENGPVAGNTNAALCEAWEKAADEFKRQGIAQRVVKLRGSAVLATDGGLLQQLLTAYRTDAGLLDKMRNQQYLPWLHVEDMAGMFSEAVRSEHYNGVYNTAADEPVSMAGLVEQVIALLENKAIAEDSPLYNGVRISSAKIKAAGFVFRYPDLQEALKDLLSR